MQHACKLIRAPFSALSHPDSNSDKPVERKCNTLQEQSGVDSDPQYRGAKPQ